MFAVGETVVHESDGICRVAEIGTLDMAHISKERKYYTLIPFYDKSSKLFIPVDAAESLREAMDEKAVMQLLEQLQEIQPIEIQDEKRREQEYKAALRSGDCNRVIQIIKTIYLRQEKRMEDGKKITEVDERYFRMAEDKLYGEIALALHMEKSEVVDFIKKYMSK